MKLEFCDLAKVLYPYCGGTDTHAEFVITLTNKIMKGKPGHSIGCGYVNPMIAKNRQSLQKFFSGKRSIPHKDARAILAHIDKTKFEKFIMNSTSDQARTNIAKELNNRGVSHASMMNVEEICADIFEEILIYGIYERNADE
jgi:hypothetical protein